MARQEIGLQPLKNNAREAADPASSGSFWEHYKQGLNWNIS